MFHFLGKTWKILLCSAGSMNVKCSCIFACSICDYVKRSGVTLKRIHSDKAFYSPVQDTMIVPEMSQYREVAEFYSTRFHEAVHSTGYSNCLNRITAVAQYGSASYSKEELPAELGSSFLVNAAGLETKGGFDNLAGLHSGLALRFEE